MKPPFSQFKIQHSKIPCNPQSAIRILQLEENLYGSLHWNPAHASAAASASRCSARTNTWNGANYGPAFTDPKSRRKHTEYGLGLIEKQKLRYFYGLMERQFARRL